MALSLDRRQIFLVQEKKNVMVDPACTGQRVGFLLCLHWREVLHGRPTYLEAGIEGQVFVNRAGLSAAEGSRCECSAIYWLTQACVAFLDLFSNVCTPGIGGQWFKYLGSMDCRQNLSFCLIPRHHIFLLLDPYQLCNIVGYLYLFQSRFSNHDYDT